MNTLQCEEDDGIIFLNKCMKFVKCLIKIREKEFDVLNIYFSSKYPTSCTMYTWVFEYYHTNNVFL